MDAQRNLHIKRLREGLERISDIRQKHLTPHDPEFKAWDDRVGQTLKAIFGDHDYTQRFKNLVFWSMRIVPDFPGLSGGGWSRDDGERLTSDLLLAEQILTDALEEVDFVPIAQQIKSSQAPSRLRTEAKGAQRWSVMARSLDALKKFGKPVYDRVAIPLLLEILKKQAGL